MITDINIKKAKDAMEILDKSQYNIYLYWDNTQIMHDYTWQS